MGFGGICLVQRVLSTQRHGKKPQCAGEMLARMKTASSSFLQLPNGKQNNKLGPQLNKHATNRAELKWNRCCCSCTRLGARSSAGCTSQDAVPLTSSLPPISHPFSPVYPVLPLLLNLQVKNPPSLLKLVLLG